MQKPQHNEIHVTNRIQYVLVFLLATVEDKWYNLQTMIGSECILWGQLLRQYLFPSSTLEANPIGIVVHLIYDSNFR